MKNDMVNHPSHYTNGKIECIDAIEAATTGLVGLNAVCTANIIKYIWRWENKNGLEDLYKAEWYLKKLITRQEERQGVKTAKDSTGAAPKVTVIPLVHEKEEYKDGTDKQMASQA